jgi:basic membrane protein A and related proteins
MVVTCLTVITLMAGCAAPPAAAPQTKASEPTVAAVPTQAAVATQVPAPTQGAQASAATTKKCKVALVLMGPINDGSFNQTAYEGLMAIKDQLGCEVSFAESVPTADFNETYRDYSQKGYDIIMGHGYEFGEPASKIAPEFPNIKYLVSNGDVKGPNLASLEPVFEEAGYLVGAVAGYMTKTNKVAAIGGMKFPIIVRGIEAFGAGCKHVNPKCQATTVYIGTLTDVAKAKEAALAQLSVGSDVVFHIANEAGLGVIQACKEQGKFAVGFGYDQNSEGPQTVLTSFTSSYQKLLLGGVQRVLDGKFEGSIQKYGLATGVVDTSPYHDLVPADVAAKVDALKAEIIAGKVEIPRLDVPPGN